MRSGKKLLTYYWKTMRDQAFNQVQDIMNAYKKNLVSNYGIL